MKKYQILEHISDLKIIVFGRTKEELFKNTMAGMFEEARYEGEGKKTKKEIKIISSDLSSLLVDFLSEVLYLSEVNHQVYYQIQFKKFTDENVEGILLGKKIRKIGVVIKGVTYHDLNIHQRKDGFWEATVLFDI